MTKKEYKLIRWLLCFSSITFLILGEVKQQFNVNVWIFMIIFVLLSSAMYGLLDWIVSKSYDAPHE